MVIAGRLVSGLLGSALSVVLLGAALWALQSATGPADQVAERVATSFSLPEVKKPPPKRKRRQATRKRRSSSRASRPTVAVSSGLSGPSFGLATLDVQGADELGADLLAAGDDVVMTESTVDVPPVPSRRTAPSYPARARRDGVEGEVRLSLLIDAGGRVTQARVLDARPPGVFDDAALAAVRSWQFQPARYKGRPVKTWAQQRVAFQLR
jgi:protein TonB